MAKKANNSNTKKKTTTKKTKQVVIEEVIKEEPVIEAIEETKVEEVKEEKKVKAEENKDKTSIKLSLSAIIGLVAIALLIIILLLTNTSKNTYKLSQIQGAIENDYSITLPHNYYLVDSGEIIRKDNGIYKSVGGIQTIEATEEEYEQTLLAYIQYYGAIEIENDNFKGFYINLANSETEVYTCYYLYKDGLIFSLIFDNVDETFAQSIIDTIK